MTFILIKQKKDSTEAYIDYVLSPPITESNISVEAEVLITTVSKTIYIAGFSSLPSVDNRLFNIEFGFNSISCRSSPYKSLNVIDKLTNTMSKILRSSRVRHFYPVQILGRYCFKWIKIKIDLDFVNRALTLFVDGIQKAKNNFERSYSQLKILRIGISGSTPLLGMMFVDNIKIYSTTKIYLNADFEDMTLGGGVIDDNIVSLYFITAPYAFDWSRATIMRLSLPIGPNGTNHYRDPTIIHDEKGFAIRINGYFYMCPANHISKDVNITHRSKATLMRSRDLRKWEVVADLSQYHNLGPNGLNPTRADLMYDRARKRIYILLELWDNRNRKYFALYEASNIEDPSSWHLIVGPSKEIYGGVPWLVRNPDTDRLDAWFEYRPNNMRDYVIAYMEIDESKGVFNNPIIRYDVRESGWHTPNPVVIYSKTKLILTNPVPALGGIGSGLYCTIAVEIPGTDDIAILKNGTWNNPEIVRKHETPRLIATQEMLDSGRFWLMWWEGDFNSGAHTMMLMSYGNPSIDDIPNILILMALRKLKDA